MKKKKLRALPIYRKLKNKDSKKRYIQLVNIKKAIDKELCSLLNGSEINDEFSYSFITQLSKNLKFYKDITADDENKYMKNNNFKQTNNKYNNTYCQQMKSLNTINSIHKKYNNKNKYLMTNDGVFKKRADGFEGDNLQFKKEHSDNINQSKKNLIRIKRNENTYSISSKKNMINKKKHSWYKAGKKRSKGC